MTHFVPKRSVILDTGLSKAADNWLTTDETGMLNDEWPGRVK